MSAFVPVRVVVAGLGRMGLPLAVRIAAAHETVGVDPAAGRRALAEGSGVRTSEGVAAALAEADVLLTVLPGPGELRALLADAEVLRSAAGSDALWIDATSCDPTTGAELHAAAREAGVRSVAAPMLGGPSDAEEGTLGFHLGGEAADVEAARVLLDPLGPSSSALVVGPSPADAYLTKLLGNLLWFGQAVAVTEALLIGARHGLAPSPLRAVLAAGPGGGRFLDRDADALLRGDPMDSFGIDRVVEELRHLTSPARASGIPTPLSDAVTRVHEEALRRYGPRGGELLGAVLLQEDAGIDLSGVGDAVLTRPHPPEHPSGG